MHVIDRLLWTSILMILTLMCVCLIGFVPYGLSALFAAIVLFLTYRYKTQQLKHYKVVQLGLFALGMAIIYGQYSTLLGVDAGVAFLSLCLFCKSFELKHTRDVLVILIFALFVSASLFLHSQSFVMTLMVLVLLLGCFVGLYRLQTIGFIKRTQAPITMKQDAKQVAKFVASALPFFVVLFIFFPRFPPFWHIPIPQDSATTGLSDTMSPGDIAKLSQSSELAFRIIGDMTSLPPRSELYWRAMVLENYDGNTWHRQQMPFMVSPEQLLDKAVVPYQYLAGDPEQKWIMSLEYSRPASPHYALFSDGSVMPKRMTQSTQPIEMYWLKDTTLTTASPALTQNRLFNQKYDTQAQKLAQMLWQQSGQDPNRYVQIVLDWYRKQGFVYTLTPGTLGKHRVDEFLFGSKQGFCEHYASSFSLMMRYVGVPARVVLGYQGGQFAPDGNSWEVRQLDAHAWTEVWLDDRWVRIDPTAIIAPSRIDEGMSEYMTAQSSVFGQSSAWQYYHMNLGRKIQVWSDYASYQWQSKVVGYDVDSQKSFLSKFGLSSLFEYVGALIAMILVLISIYAWWYLKQRYAHMDNYQKLIMKFNSKVPTHQQQQLGESFMMWMTRLKGDDVQTCFDEAASIYQRVHYANQPKTDDFKQFANALKLCQHYLSTQPTKHTKKT